MAGLEGWIDRHVGHMTLEEKIELGRSLGVPHPKDPHPELAKKMTMGDKMITAEQREIDFRKDLKDLLKRHGAEMEITDDGKSYGRQSGVCRINMASIYVGEVLTKDYCEFDV